MKERERTQKSNLLRTGTMKTSASRKGEGLQGGEASGEKKNVSPVIGHTPFPHSSSKEELTRGERVGRTKVPDHGQKKKIPVLSLRRKNLQSRKKEKKLDGGREFSSKKKRSHVIFFSMEKKTFPQCADKGKPHSPPYEPPGGANHEFRRRGGGVLMEAADDLDWGEKEGEKLSPEWGEEIGKGKNQEKEKAGVLLREKMKITPPPLRSKTGCSSWGGGGRHGDRDGRGRKKEE